jgi:branched-chain amino acid transport system ATP-binding protein
MTVTSATQMSSPVLVAEGLNAGYDGVPVVHGLDLVINHGEVVALLGANGAGKTTTLLTIAGLLPPISGSLAVLGELAHDEDGRGRRVRRNSLTRTWKRARRGLSLVPEDRGLFPCPCSTAHKASRPSIRRRATNARHCTSARHQAQTSDGR